MIPDRNVRIRQIFEAARERSASQRAKYLDGVCCGDDDLRAHVEALIAASGSMNPDAPARSFLPTGTILDGKYRVERELGKGGMGAVYLATHLGTTRTVALKTIIPELAARDEFLIRFRREAEAAGRLRHPNVVNVTDFGLTNVAGVGIAYLVMEYLDGQTLSDYQKTNGRPSIDLVVDIIEQIALALDEAHSAGIVHRDLKPDNVWLESNRRGGFNVKVLDFGIAKLANAIASSSEVRSASRATASQVAKPVDTIDPDTIPTMAIAAIETTGGTHLETQAGAVLGTPSYMSPEQCRGDVVDYRTDIYGLATIAYELLTGERPFKATTVADLMRRQIEEPAAPPRERNASLPKALSDAVLQGLNKDPAKRPQTAGTLASLIRAGSEAEFSVMRQAKDVFNSNTSYFLPSWAFCFSPVMVVVVLALLFAPLAVKAGILPQFAVGFWATELFAILFCLQLYKAATTILLSEAASSKSFRPATKRVAKQLFRGLPEFISTLAASLIDLRLSSFRDNLLWPVVWAQEGLSGHAALAHSRELCRTVPAASLTMVPRQYSPALVAVLSYPAMFGALTGVSIVVWGTAIFSSGVLWWGLITQPLIALAVYSRYGVAFSFLYWFAHVCRGEGTMPNLPAAGLRPEKKRNPNRQPVVLLWWLVPLVMTAIIFLSPHLRNHSTYFEQAMSDVRAAAILKEIDGGVSVNASDLNGWTPLQAAARLGDTHLAEALLKRGANVNARGNSKSTPLITAAEYNRADLAAMFLSHGASVTAVDEDGRSALIMAALRGNEEIVSMLLEHGASPSAKDNNGKAALDYAREEGYADVVARLTR